MWPPCPPSPGAGWFSRPLQRPPRHDCSPEPPRCKHPGLLSEHETVSSKRNPDDPGTPSPAPSRPESAPRTSTKPTRPYTFRIQTQVNEGGELHASWCSLAGGVRGGHIDLVRPRAARAGGDDRHGVVLVHVVAEDGERRHRRQDRVEVHVLRAPFGHVLVLELVEGHDAPERTVDVADV